MQMHSLNNSNEMKICDPPSSFRKSVLKAFHASSAYHPFSPPSGASHSSEFCVNYSLLIFVVFIIYVYLQPIWHYLVLPGFEHHTRGIVLYVFSDFVQCYSWDLSTILYVLLDYSFCCWYSILWIYHNLSIHSTTDRHLGCLQFGAACYCQ